jgi:Fe2+ or Zn2+ uptake regulation protein
MIRDFAMVYKLVNDDGLEMELTLDLTETGLEMFFRPYQIKALELLWSTEETLSSRQVWEKVNEGLPGTISRASIINFLNASVENGLLDFVETTGKGGYRRLYNPKLSKVETAKYLSEEVQKALITL